MRFIPRLDTGVVDAAEFISLQSNYKLGLHKVTKYLLWPSFHSPTTLDEISVNMDAWNELPADLQAAFRLAAARISNDFDYKVSAGDYGALEEIKATGVKHVSLSDADKLQIRNSAGNCSMNGQGKASLPEGSWPLSRTTCKPPAAGRISALGAV